MLRLNYAASSGRATTATTTRVAATTIENDVGRKVGQKSREGTT